MLFAGEKFLSSILQGPTGEFQLKKFAINSTLFSLLQFPHIAHSRESLSCFCHDGEGLESADTPAVMVSQEG